MFLNRYGQDDCNQCSAVAQFDVTKTLKQFELENDFYRFLGRKDILLVDFMKRGVTIIVDVYCKMLTKLKRVNQNPGRRKLSSKETI